MIIRSTMVVTLLLSLTTQSVSAQAPISCVNELTGPELDVRLDLLDDHFQRNQRSAQWHWYGFMSLFAALGVSSIFLAATSETPVGQFSNTLGAVGALLVTVQMAVITQPAATAPDAFRALPDDTLPERRAKLRFGLEQMELAADRQDFVSRPFTHVLPLIWSGTWGTVVMLKFDAPWTVLQMAGTGIAVTEFRLLSSPRGAIRSWEAIRGSFCGGRYVHRLNNADRRRLGLPQVDQGPQITFAPTFGGMSLHMTF